ncbi:signal recognition particle SRP9 SRP14 subunit [Infundibulicybe gibba]|nr:signal recognition particle SRP9 SRP14 subunit [Infundibulicybe gibba]
MVYVQSWQEYQDAAEALYTKSPNNTRYCVKWKSSEGKLVLKITDNTTCLKFKTYSSIFLNRFEALNQSLMTKMSNKRQEEPLAPAPGILKTEQARASPLPGATPSVAISSGPPAGGVKKKKPKKKK